MSDITLTKKEIDDIIILFNNDTEIQELLYKYDIFLTEEEEIELATLLLVNSDTINYYTIDELYNMESPFLGKELAIFFDIPIMTRDIYNQIFYVFKYGTIRKFFKDNWTRFMPDYDVLYIQDSEKMILFQEAFMKEFDKFSDIIDRVYDIMDIDSIPSEYLNYLAQLVGYEREDDVILTNIAFRELLKNIIEVYKIKGTNFSFELFFNFLGFEVTLKEYWFDKRYYYNINTNPETNETDKDLFNFYLSSQKPTNYIPEGMSNPFIISEDSITGTMNLNDFNKMLELGTYTLRQLLGIDLGYPDQPYEYFKTNVMEYTLDAISTGGDAGGSEGSLTAEQNKIIKKYADFLTPVFVQSNISVNIPPFEDDGAVLRLKDESYLLNEINYLDSIHSEMTDLESRFYSHTHTTNAPFYLAVKDHYSLPTEDLVLEKISELMDGSSLNFWDNVIPTFYGAGDLYEAYDPMQRREIFYPLIDSFTFTPSIDSGKEVELVTSNVTLGADFYQKKGSIKRLSDATAMDSQPKANVLSLNVTTKKLIISDPNDDFINLVVGNYVKLIAMNVRSQDGYYKIETLTKSGDNTEIIIDALDTPIPGSSQVTPGGFLQPYVEDWKLGNAHYPFLWDRVLETS